MLPVRMKALGVLARTAFAAAACLAATACERSPPISAVVITHATFGLYRVEKTGQAAFTPARVVPFAVGQQYGWLIKLRTSRPSVRWREELVLPAAPATWGVERVGHRSVAANNRSIVTEREVSPRSGYIFNAWQIDPGDPRGRYTITVSIEDGPARRFAFEVK